MSRRSIFTKVLAPLFVVAVVAVGAGALYWTHFRQTSPKQYDVVVVGAGPGGVAASIQAARMGRTVALLEPTDWIGGQMTAAGVGTMDEGSTAARQSGLYAEFLKKVTNYYHAQDKSVGTCYYNTNAVCVDPQVGQKLLRQMLAAESKNLHVYTDTAVTSVAKQGDTVTGVMAGNTYFASKVVIDADEYGDVLALAGANYRLGNGTASQPNDNGCIQNITYTAVIKQYPKGVPANLRFKQPPPGYNSTVAAHFATYLKQNGYGLTVKPNKTVASNRMPMDMLAYAAYRGYPDTANPANYNAFQQDGHTITRTSLDLGNDYPLTGVLSTKYVSDPKYREQVDCQAKLTTLQLAYYIQHDLGQSNWSIANDEGYDTAYAKAHNCAQLNDYKAFEDNMSQEAYVREARRLVGTETLTGNDMVTSWNRKKYYTSYPDSIAVGYYPMDLHQCNEQDTLESAFDSTQDNLRGGPFEVPMGTLIPEKVDGLLAAEKNISVSRMANGSIREQPIAMDTGQAAGALAALAVEHHEQPRAVQASEVQSALRNAHEITAFNQVHS
jgi:FAD dependent oxidoreductase